MNSHHIVAAAPHLLHLSFLLWVKPKPLNVQHIGPLYCPTHPKFVRWGWVPDFQGTGWSFSISSSGFPSTVGKHLFWKPFCSDNFGHNWSWPCTCGVWVSVAQLWIDMLWEEIKMYQPWTYYISFSSYCMKNKWLALKWIFMKAL